MVILSYTLINHGNHFYKSAWEDPYSQRTIAEEKTQWGARSIIIKVLERLLPAFLVAFDEAKDLWSADALIPAALQMILPGFFEAKKISWHYESLEKPIGEGVQP